MLSLLTSSYNNTAKIVLAAITYTLVACNAQSVSPVSISPKHFKVKTPFMLDKRGIIINTYWEVIENIMFYALIPIRHRG